jgi:AcrR family transcriptional regulator
VTPTIRRTQGERVDESTRRLLEAAAELIAVQGYHNTTAGQIAQRAGFSRELVRVRFGSKDALIREILATEYQDRLRSRVDEADALGALHAGVNQLTELGQRSPVFLRAVFVLNLEAATSIPELRGPINEWLEAVELNFRTLLALGVKDGSVRADVDVSDKAHELLTLSIGAAYLFVLNPTEIDPGHILRRALEDLAPDH